jgi:hypothetical protein
MTASIRELIDQLGAPDGGTRARALAALVMQGRAAAADLELVLANPNPRLRASAAQGLAEVADPASAEALIKASYDSDEEVRSHAAHGLARIGDSHAMDALLRTFDDFPDVLHGPFTLSAYALIDMGRGVVQAVAPLLKSPRPATRARAFAVIQAVVSASPEGRDWAGLWHSLGGYDPDAEAADRDRAADLWIEWSRTLSLG